MKKSLIITFGACLFALGIFSAFSDGMSAEQKEQQQKIQDLLTERLDEFRVEKEQECTDRAIAVAVAQADSIMTARSAAKTPVRKKPNYTTKGTTTNPTPPAPKSDGEKARDKMRKNTDAATKTTTAPATKEELKETANKAKSKMRKKKGDD